MFCNKSINRRPNGTKPHAERNAVATMHAVSKVMCVDHFVRWISINYSNCKDTQFLQLGKKKRCQTHNRTNCRSVKHTMGQIAEGVEMNFSELLWYQISLTWYLFFHTVQQAQCTWYLQQHTIPQAQWPDIKVSCISHFSEVIIDMCWY